MCSLPAVVGDTQTALLPLCRVTLSSEQCLSWDPSRCKQCQAVSWSHLRAAGSVPWGAAHSSSEPACDGRLLGLSEPAGIGDVWEPVGSLSIPPCPAALLGSSLSSWAPAALALCCSQADNPQDGTEQCVALQRADVKHTWDRFKGMDVSALLADLLYPHYTVKFSHAG